VGYLPGKQEELEMTGPHEQRLLLYPDGAPGSENWSFPEAPADIFWSDQKVIRNVSQPSLEVFLPDPAIAQGTGVILCPGGGWHFLAVQQEGIDVARKLNAIGVAAFVLRYRLIQTGDDYKDQVQRNFGDAERRATLMDELRPMILRDGQEAVKLVRQHAEDWGVEKVGMMGYSAGGNVVMNVALQHDSDSRPDFVSAIYTAMPDDVPLPDDTPPLFVLCTADDEMASASSTRLYSLWKEKKIPVEMHIYSKGGHGFCLRTNNLPVDGWLDRFVEWMKAEGFVR
jgi:acetyl esterase/lipase